MKKLVLLFALLFAGFTYAQEVCNDGIDNDGDGLVDCADNECAGTACGNAIPCPTSSIFYQTINGNLFVRYNPFTLSYDTIHNNNFNINAIGYNYQDGFFYGLTHFGNTLVRIGADGVYQNLGSVSGLPSNGSFFIGDMDTNGFLYAKGGGSTTYKIDVSSQTATPLPNSTTMGAIADWSYNPADGYFYAVNNNGNLVYMNPATGSATNLGAVSPPPACNSGFGATYMDNSGNLYSFCNQSGNLYKTELSTQTSSLLHATGISLSINDGASCALAAPLVVDPCDSLPLRTQTQGGWGTGCNGNNPGCYRDANFADAFPNGLTIGCDSGFTVTFTSAQAIEDFLPCGGTAAVLSASHTDPDCNDLKNVLVSQLTAISLSLGFDANDTAFGASSTALADMVIDSGNVFAGMDVATVVAMANDVIGGCSNAYSVSDLNEALTGFNESFVDGTSDSGFLVCPSAGSGGGQTNSKVFILPTNYMHIAPNPTNGSFTFMGTLETGVDELITYTVYTALGEVVKTASIGSELGAFHETIDLSGYESGIYVVIVQSSTDQISQKVLKN